MLLHSLLACSHHHTGSLRSPIILQCHTLPQFLFAASSSPPLASLADNFFGPSTSSCWLLVQRGSLALAKQLVCSQARIQFARFARKIECASQVVAPPCCIRRPRADAGAHASRCRLRGPNGWHRHGSPLTPCVLSPCLSLTARAWRSALVIPTPSRCFTILIGHARPRSPA